MGEQLRIPQRFSQTKRVPHPTTFFLKLNESAQSTPFSAIIDDQCNF
jgi:hypothetical protein